jgi:phage major head subunit gpT-like protein
MAIINAAVLQTLFTGYARNFQEGFQLTQSVYQQIATEVPSVTRSNTYGFLGQFPTFREWVGERVIRDMAAHGYSIANKDYESTIEVPRTAIEDDQYQLYDGIFKEAGRAARLQPDELIFDLLQSGQTIPCYDGYNFFDTAHPVFANADGTGAITPVSNVNAGGTGRFWYLLDTSRTLKPLIFQNRKPPTVTSMTSPTDEGVFTRNAYRFGIDSRCNAGYGFWQMAYASNQPLTAANYAAARAAMQAFAADGGRKLGIRPNTLVVPVELESAARRLIIKDEQGGNEWAGSALLIVTPYLS